MNFFFFMLKKRNPGFKKNLLLLALPGFLLIAILLGRVFADEGDSEFIEKLPFDTETFQVFDDEYSLKFGFTKEEFNELPISLRKAILTEPEEIGKSFQIPTKEEWERSKEIEKRKMEEIEEAERKEFQRNGIKRSFIHIPALVYAGSPVIKLVFILSFY